MVLLLAFEHDTSFFSVTAVLKVVYEGMKPESCSVSSYSTSKDMKVFERTCFLGSTWFLSDRLILHDVQSRERLGKEHPRQLQ